MNPYEQATNLAAPWSAATKGIFDGERLRMEGQNRMATALAQQEQARARANLFDQQSAKTQAETDALKQRSSLQTPEFGNKIAAALNGLSDQQGTELTNFQTRGNWGESRGAELPEGQEGPPMPVANAQPDWYNPQVAQRFNQARGAHLAGLGATGNTNGEQMIDAYAKLLGQNRIDQVIQNPAQAAALGKAMAASQGKALFHQGANGVMDQFTGAETINDIGRSAIAENRAQANSANAAAAQHLASRDLTRSKIGQATVNPDGSVSSPVGKPLKLSATAEKELFEADDNIKSTNSTIGLLQQAKDFNNKAYSGYFAKSRAVARSNLPGESEQANATIQLDNIMTTQALESLKSTFGAAPTEGERKILLDIQASADKTPKQREEIIDRAIKAAENRMRFNVNKAKSLRSGTYNSVDPQASPQGADIDALLKKYGN